ncbi:MAG: TraV family lipoprotein [Sulfuritalea sp.]|nr:TraV family lipoprotein [Sulfuritalea sp.]
MAVNNKRQLILALAVVELAGCSAMGVGNSEFSCSKEKTGMPCASVDEVYGKTNGANWRPAPVSKDKQVNEPQRAATATPMTAPNFPAPVLEPAQVMRIWVAPWVDDAQSLHWPSYVFTEVTPRKWSFGNSDFVRARQLVPLQVDRRAEPGETPAAPTSPTAQPVLPSR